MRGDIAAVAYNGFTGGSACLLFYYHMYGTHVGQLNVYLGNKKIFSKVGDQGNAWKKAEVSINGLGEVSSLNGSSA